MQPTLHSLWFRLPVLTTAPMRLHTSLLHTSLLHTSLLHRYLVKEAATLEATMQGLAQSADLIALENAKLKREQSTGLVARVVGRFMVRTMRDKLVAAQAAERAMRSNQAEVHARVVHAEQKCTAMEREVMISRRRQAERDAAYEQQKADASELSVENRMLLERTEQMLVDGQRYVPKLSRWPRRAQARRLHASAHHGALTSPHRYVAKLEMAEARCIELAAELELVRERAELDRALRALRPEDLAAVSRVNHALAESIQSLLPRLESGKKASEGGAPYRAHSAQAPSSERWTGGSYS